VTQANVNIVLSFSHIQEVTKTKRYLSTCHQMELCLGPYDAGTAGKTDSLPRREVAFDFSSVSTDGASIGSTATRSNSSVVVIVAVFASADGVRAAGGYSDRDRSIWRIVMSKITGYDTHDDGPGFVGIRFCQECNNMLYPKEDKENKVLMYAVSILFLITDLAIEYHKKERKKER